MTATIAPAQVFVSTADASDVERNPRASEESGMTYPAEHPSSP